MRLRAGLFFVAFLLPFRLFAVDYTFFVSPTGGGDMSGSDISNPMRGLYNAILDIRYDETITGDDRVTLNILSGIYHFKGDSLLRWQGWDKPYLIMNGLGGFGDINRPVLSGLEEIPLGPWTNLGGNVWEADWPYDFGYGVAGWENYVCGPGFDGWIGCLLDEYIPDPATGQWRDGRTIMRREYVVEAGVRFTQVTMPEFVETMPGTFCTPLEGAGSIQINTPADPNVIPVFAANAAYLLAIRNARGVEIHNLEFEYANPFIKNGMLDISCSDHILIEDCYFHHSNADGINVRQVPQQPINPDDPNSEFQYVDEALVQPGYWTIDDCESAYCGFYGMLSAHSMGLLSTDCYVHHNNLRGYEAGTMEYDTGGAKLFRSRHSRVENYLGEWNYGVAMWFDLDGRDLTLKNSTLRNNYFRGFYVERSPGPILLENVVMENNNQPMDSTIIRFRPSAMGISSTDTITVRNCVLSDPARYPLMLHTPDYLLEPGLAPPYGDPVYVQAWHNSFEHCMFSRPDPSLPFIWFVVNATTFRCYYMFHTEFNHVTFQTMGLTNTNYMVMADMARFCTPIEVGNNYDYRDLVQDRRRERP